MEKLMSFNLADGTTLTCFVTAIVAIQSHRVQPHCTNLWLQGVASPFVVTESHDEILRWIEEQLSTEE